MVAPIYHVASTLTGNNCSYQSSVPKILGNLGPGNLDEIQSSGESKDLSNRAGACKQT